MLSDGRARVKILPTTRVYVRLQRADIGSAVFRWDQEDPIGGELGWPTIWLCL
ncbi:hypothetical protein JHK87_056585 [Glycine soja]|nr:hypothetical protein JHK87_056585 [Glycine soja]